MLRLPANRVLVFSLATVFVCASQAFSSAVPAPAVSWKIGNGFHITLRASRPGNSEQRYDMHVIVTGAEKRGGADCWRVKFIPIAAPSMRGGDYLAWIDKSTGAIRMVVSNHTQKAVPLSPLDGLPISPLLLPGYPLEVLPFVGVSPYHYSRWLYLLAPHQPSGG